MHSAVKPFVVLAKQHFRPLADPTSGPMCLMFNDSCRWVPEIAEVRECDPEMGMEGRDHVVSLREGGLPIMPPSRKLIVGVWVVKRAAIERAVPGEMALRSI